MSNHSKNSIRIPKKYLNILIIQINPNKKNKVLRFVSPITFKITILESFLEIFVSTFLFQKTARSENRNNKMLWDRVIRVSLRVSVCSNVGRRKGEGGRAKWRRRKNLVGTKTFPRIRVEGDTHFLIHRKSTSVTITNENK